MPGCGSYACLVGLGEVVFSAMPLLVLVPCSSGKTLPIKDGLRGRMLRDIPSEQRTGTWRTGIAAAQPRVEVRQLYKGGAWSIAKDIAAAAAQRHGGTTLVVSAGLGLVAIDSLAPGYDITFTAGSPDEIPGGNSPAARVRWWQELAGPEALEAALSSGHYNQVLAALPEAYLEAVAPCIAKVMLRLGVDNVSVLASSLTHFTKLHLSDCWVKVAASKTTGFRGNAGQSQLSAALYTLQALPVGAPPTRDAVQALIDQLVSRASPLYPKRERLGREHAVTWLNAAFTSGDSPESASEALRRYRKAGFAYEQKAFHQLFAEVVEHP
jgi:hypothetical protein